MKYGAYHVWLRVSGLTTEEREGVRLTLEKAAPGWEWDFVSEPDGSIWIAPLIKGDDPDSMDQHAVRAVRPMLPHRPAGQAEVGLSVERFERRR